LYGVNREDVDYILGTFSRLKVEGEALPGMASQRKLIQEAYERLSAEVST
jgi:hypothetical protein